jgi:hypothetical protein
MTRISVLIYADRVALERLAFLARHCCRNRVARHQTN